MTSFARLTRITKRSFLFHFIFISSFSSVVCPYRGWSTPNHDNAARTSTISDSDRARIDFRAEYENVLKEMQPAAAPKPPDATPIAAGSPGAGQSTEDTPEPSSKQSLTILFSGDEGIPFPSASEVVLKEAGLAEHELASSTPWPTPTPWSKPGRCEKNETLLVELTADGDDREVRYDLLFLPEHLVPLQPDDVFGSEVMLYPYGEKSGVSGELWQKVHEVPCVPFRVRLTERGYRHDLGHNALKNYSTGQAGRGEFHPWIAGQLYGSLKKTTRRR